MPRLLRATLPNERYVHSCQARENRATGAALRRSPTIPTSADGRVEDRRSLLPSFRCVDRIDAYPQRREDLTGSADCQTPLCGEPLRRMCTLGRHARALARLPGAPRSTIDFASADVHDEFG